MQDPVEIVLRGVPQSSALERYIREQALKLDREGGAVLNCHVVAEALHRQKQQGPQFSVRLNITLPGTEVMVNREHGDDVYIALRDAFEAASLQLRDRRRRQSGVQPRSHNGTPQPRR